MSARRRVRRMKRGGLAAAVILSTACADDLNPARPAASSAAPKDAQHQGISTPHGDHSPHHGGIVLMNGELHYEVVLDSSGHHRIWFSNAVREDLPASVARDVRMVVMRPKEADETIALEIDDAGESWIARARPLAGKDVMVKVSYSVQGQPYEIEIPFVPPSS